MTGRVICVIFDYRNRNAGFDPRKGKAMITINRLFELNSALKIALLGSEEKGFGFACAVKVSIKRSDCILEPGVV